MSSNQSVPDKWHYSWEEFGMHTKRLIEVINREKMSPAAVLVLGRGGAPLGASLANAFGIRMYYWGLSSYNTQNLQEQMADYQSLPSVLNKALRQLGKNLLLVDDICDTGKTFAWAAQAFPDAKRVCLVGKPGKNQTDIFAHVCAATTLNNVWVEFPWERKYGQC